MGSVKNAGAFVVVLVASFTVMNGLPVDGLRSACGQELALAFMALAGVGWRARRCWSSVVRTMCNMFARSATQSPPSEPWELQSRLRPGVSAARRLSVRLRRAAVPSAQDAAMRLILLLAICVLTAVFEESLMRALCINALRGALRANGEPRAGATRHAMLLAALLFALLHVGSARCRCECGRGVPIRAQVRAGNAIRPGHGYALR